ncbi:hypothetical protein CONCODRAFT_80754, partial [Conidiobolus coronatus NRRL 28638]
MVAIHAQSTLVQVSWLTTDKPLTAFIRLNLDATLDHLHQTLLSIFAPFSSEIDIDSNYLFTTTLSNDTTFQPIDASEYDGDLYELGPGAYLSYQHPHHPHIEYKSTQEIRDTKIYQIRELLNHPTVHYVCDQLEDPYQPHYAQLNFQLHPSQLPTHPNYIDCTTLEPVSNQKPVFLPEHNNVISLRRTKFEELLNLERISFLNKKTLFDCNWDIPSLVELNECRFCS